MKTTKPGKPVNNKTDKTTEEKILAAARDVFTKKGFAATRTRDIAEAADINLALLNYYFRSKKKLFDLIMAGKFQELFGFIGPIVYDENTSLEKKIEALVSCYVQLLLENPDLPYFVLGEARNDPGLVINAMQKKDFLKNSVFFRQLIEKRPDLDPYQFLMSLLGMTIFPFIMKPVFKTLTDTSDLKYKQMMLQRQKLIPVWCKSLLKSKS